MASHYQQKCLLTKYLSLFMLTAQYPTLIFPPFIGSNLLVKQHHPASQTRSQQEASWECLSMDAHMHRGTDNLEI